MREVCSKRWRWGIRCIGETMQKEMKRLTSEGDMRRNVFMEKVYYTISRAFIDIPGIIVSYSFLQTLCPKKKRTPQPPQKCLMTRPGHGYAIACSSFLRRSIALPNAFIIPSYIISLSRNVPVSLISFHSIEMSIRHKLLALFLPCLIVFFHHDH